MLLPAIVRSLPSVTAATPGPWDLSPPTQYAVMVGLPVRALTPPPASGLGSLQRPPAHSCAPGLHGAAPLRPAASTSHFCELPARFQ